MANYTIYWKQNLCSICKVRERKDGYSWCFSCLVKKYREYYKKNRKAYIKRTTEFIKKHRDRYKKYASKCSYKLRLKVQELYGKKCRCCGEKEPKFLTLHHVEGNGAKERKEIKKKGGSEFYRWLLKQPYNPSKYEILCLNCNKAIYEYGECPHKIKYENTKK